MELRRTEIKRHLPEREIDEMLREAEDENHLRGIGFIKNRYQGDTIPEATDRGSRSAATRTRWPADWNERGFDKFMPSFAGRPQTRRRTPRRVQRPFSGNFRENHVTDELRKEVVLEVP